jgi:hypothetical protein
VGSGVFGLEVFSDYSVEGASSLIGDDSGVDLEGVSLLVFLNKFLLFELLKSPSDDLGAGVLVSFGSALSSVESSVDVGEESDSRSGSDVDLSGKGCDLVVDPVFVDGGEFVA